MLITRFMALANGQDVMFERRQITGNAEVFNRQRNRLFRRLVPARRFISRMIALRDVPSAEARNAPPKTRSNMILPSRLTSGLISG